MLLRVNTGVSMTEVYTKLREQSAKSLPHDQRPTSPLAAYSHPHSSRCILKLLALFIFITARPKAPLSPGPYYRSRVPHTVKRFPPLLPADLWGHILRSSSDLLHKLSSPHLFTVVLPSQKILCCNRRGILQGQKFFFCHRVQTCLITVHPGWCLSVYQTICDCPAVC